MTAEMERRDVRHQTSLNYMKVDVCISHSNLMSQRHFLGTVTDIKYELHQYLEPHQINQVRY